MEKQRRGREKRESKGAREKNNNIRKLAEDAEEERGREEGEGKGVGEGRRGRGREEREEDAESNIPLGPLFLVLISITCW